MQKHQTFTTPVYVYWVKVGTITNIKSFEPDGEKLFWSFIQIGPKFATDKETYAVSYRCTC